jgi:hypothetical protein
MMMVLLLLSDDFQLYQIMVDCEDSGHGGASRNRTYIFCRNYHTCLAVYDVFDLYEKVRGKIMKCVQTRPRDYMIADDVEIMLAAQAVARSRKIPFQADNRDLSYLLNQRETGIVQRLSEEYERRYHEPASEAPDLAMFLGDNDSYSKTWSACSGKIPTFRMSGGLMWLPHWRRWMCSSEKLATFGFPVRQFIAEAMGTPVLPIRDEKRASDVAGNCMNLSTVTIVEMIGLSCFAKR